VFTSLLDDGDGCGAVQLRSLARLVADRPYPPEGDPPVMMAITAMAPSAATIAAMVSVTSSLVFRCGGAGRPGRKRPRQ
jgi:hypothetical protein